MNQKSLRLARLLTMLPWLTQQKKVSVHEISRIFGISDKDVLTDLALLTFVGPDQAGGGLVDIQYSKEHVKVIDNQGLARPLTLNEIEIISLLMGLRTLQDLEISNSATLTAIGKLERLIKDDSLRDSVNNDLNSAIANNSILQIQYLKFSDNSISTREVEPLLIQVDGAILKLKAWCLLSSSYRTFRVDRILSTKIIDRKFVQREITEESDPPKFVISLKLDSSAKWILQQFGIRFTTEVSGDIDIQIPIHSRSWLLRFLATSAFKIKEIDLAPNEKQSLVSVLDSSINRLSKQ